MSQVRISRMKEIEDLPVDTLIIVFNFLTIPEQLCFSLTNTFFHKVSDLSEIGFLRKIMNATNRVKPMNLHYVKRIVEPLPYVICLRVGHAGYRENKELYPIRCNLNGDELIEAYEKASRELGFYFHQQCMTSCYGESSYGETPVEVDYESIMKEKGLWKGMERTNSKHYIPNLLSIVKYGNPKFRWSSKGNVTSLEGRGFRNGVFRRTYFPSGIQENREKDYMNKRFIRGYGYKKHDILFKEGRDDFCEIGVGGIGIVEEAR